MQPHDDSEAKLTRTPETPRKMALQRSELHPQYQHEFMRELPGDADEFDLIRERVLEGYGYNTARAYWGDLEHWRDWCHVQVPAVAPLQPATRDIEAYLDGMAVAGYSPNTRARRLTALRVLFNAVQRSGSKHPGTVENARPIPRSNRTRPR